MFQQPSMISGMGQLRPRTIKCAPSHLTLLGYGCRIGMSYLSDARFPPVENFPPLRHPSSITSLPSGHGRLQCLVNHVNPPTHAHSVAKLECISLASRVWTCPLS